MTFASVRAAAEHIARVGSITPHQLAALSWVDENLADEQKAEFTQLWRAAGSPAGPVPELVTMAQATAVFLRAPTAAQLSDLNGCLRRFEINTPARIAHFMAQIGHESGGLRWMTELASGEAYEGRQDLGNAQEGDGVRFKGAGALQLTGRHNYQRFADFIKDPRVMEGASYVASVYPFTSAGFWWHQNGMNAMVDRGATCRQVSARVNGRDPANGLQDREAYFSRAVEAFGSSPKLELPAQQPTGKPHLRLTRTGRVNRVGLELLELAYHRGSRKIASIDVVSGAPGAQRFRTGAQSKAGSLEPLPEGRWGIEDIAWAGGRDNYAASWGPGLGPVSVPLRYLGPGSTARSAIEIHIDSNARTSPGTAGCIGVAGEADYRKLVGWLRETDPRDLFVDYRLGTCPQPPG